eukprot:Gb_28408 [translate_table: standard]
MRLVRISCASHQRTPSISNNRCHTKNGIKKKRKRKINTYSIEHKVEFLRDLFVSLLCIIDNQICPQAFHKLQFGSAGGRNNPGSAIDMLCQLNRQAAHTACSSHN